MIFLYTFFSQLHFIDARRSHNFHLLLPLESNPSFLTFFLFSEYVCAVCSLFLLFSFTCPYILFVSIRVVYMWITKCEITEFLTKWCINLIISSTSVACDCRRLMWWWADKLAFNTCGVFSAQCFPLIFDNRPFLTCC